MKLTSQRNSEGTGAVGIRVLRDFSVLVWSTASSSVKRRFLATVLLITFASITAGLGPVVLKGLIDSFESRDANPTIPLALIGLYVLTQFVPRVSNEIRGFVYACAERSMFRALSERLFAHILHLSLRFHLDRRTGAIGQSLDLGLQGYQVVSNSLVFLILPAVVELSTAMVVLARSGQIEVLALFSVGLVCFLTASGFAVLRLADSGGRASSSHVAATAEMTDSVLNYDAVKLFAAEPFVQERVSRALEKTRSEWISFYRSYAKYGFGVTAVYATFLTATMLYAAHQVQAGRMSIGEFVLVNAYVLQVIRPVELLGQSMQALSQGLAMLKKMLDLLSEKAEPVQEVGSRSLSGAGTLIFDRVSYCYVPGRKVLTDVSFTLPAGRTLGIVGASGAGKSTLVRILVRMLEPDTGRILLDGTPLSELSLPELRRAIAVVPQDTTLFNESIAYNIRFGRPESSQEEIEQAARTANLHDFIMTLPERYETKVGERGVKLSGGERQRVSIARAVLKRPLIYVFDEATSSLDSGTEREILQNIRQISRNTTSLVIAHRLSTLVHADAIIVLEGGTIVEQGKHGELLQVRGTYAELWRAQQQYQYA
jgi:ABC-type transport system involved in Fe-S cluster assembly fused permease/ATPase subunit